MWPQQLYKSMMDIQPDSTVEFPDVILIVLFHNDFSLSSEQPEERVLTLLNLWSYIIDMSKYHNADIYVAWIEIRYVLSLKHIKSWAIFYNLRLVRDLPLGAPAYVRLVVYSWCYRVDIIILDGTAPYMNI